MITLVEIEERFGKVRPVEKWDTPIEAAQYYDFLSHAKEDIDWLIQRIKDLELTRNAAERCSCVFEEDGETILRWCDAHAIWRDKVKELQGQVAKWMESNAKCAVALEKSEYTGIGFEQRVKELEADLALEKRTCEKYIEQLDKGVKREKELEILLVEAQQWIDSEPDWKDKYNAQYLELVNRLKQTEAFKEAWVKRTEEAENRVEALERDLKFNAHLLAKQCDLAREAETEKAELVNGIKAHKERMILNENFIKPMDKDLYRLVEVK